jgi:hypothetical protein
MAGVAYAQPKPDRDQSLKKYNQAITLRDSNKLANSTKLLQELVKFEPANMAYVYELAFNYCLEQKFSLAITELNKAIGTKKANDQVYQLLGHIYLVQGKSDLATKTLDEGLKKFQHSGSLFLERAMIPLASNNIEQALAYIEKGIDAEPAFPSTYYYAARIYCSTSEKVWGLIYGEIFMNLERNSPRTLEISRLLYNTYLSGVHFSTDSTCVVNFSTVGTLNLVKGQDTSNIKMPYGIHVYGPTMSMSMIGINKLDLANLDKLRSRFVQYYYASQANIKYPNVLFDYQIGMLAGGLFSAYNYWLLQGGNEKEYQKWKSEHRAEYEAFMFWFSNNPLKLSNKYYFSRKLME